jgi:hypothetical protein
LVIIQNQGQGVFMMRIKRFFTIASILSFAACCQGCVAVAVGLGAAGTVAYIRGDLESTESKNIEVVYSAALQATEQFQLSLISKSKDALSATIVARDAQDSKITIKMTSVSEQTTKLSIRVGTFGDETKSQQIYQKIYNNMYPIKT